MKSTQLQRGSGHLVVIIILVVALLGALTFIFFQNFITQPTEETIQSSTSQESEAQFTETYTSELGMFTINYPSDWVLEREVDDSDPIFPYESSSLTSPTGTVLVLRADNASRGGTCPPNEGDVPFAAGNACSSFSYLSSERLEINNAYYRTNTPNNFDTEMVNVYLVTAKYGSPDGDIQYILGVENDFPDRTIELNAEEMGFIVPETMLITYTQNGTSKPYLYIYTITDEESFLSSAEANTVKEIIRTLKINN